MTSPVRLVPLGGLGEIGMNCMALEHEGHIMVIDCGVTFPDDDLGVDVIHPDFEYLLRHRDRVRGIVLTHGHEDHIGGLPYLLAECPVPVFGPPYALALVRRRLEEHDLPEPPDLHPTTPGRSFSLGSFDIEPFRVTHSIPDCTGLLIRVGGSLLVHTGDFKLDPAPPDRQPFDEERLRAAGDVGVDLLMSDSTNIDVPGTAGPESGVQRALSDLVKHAEQRVVVAVFGSNVHRLNALFEAAEAHGRRVCLLGRSVRTHARIARELGVARRHEHLLVPSEDARRVPRHELLAIATGTQGEPPAAMARLAAGKHPDLDLEPGDLVVLSSRVIPGCEIPVYQMRDALEQLGVTVVHGKSHPGVHVSGHACRDEQRAVLEMVRPKSFLPVHGTFHHLKRHADLARELGVTDVLVTQNGSAVELGPGGLSPAGEVPAGRVFVAWGEELPESVVRERALLAKLGIATVAVPIDRRFRRAGPCRVTTRGYLDEELDEELVAEAEAFVASELDRARRDLDSLDEVETRARRALKRFFAKELGRKPLVSAMAVRVS